MDELQRGGVVKGKDLRDPLKESRGIPYAAGGPIVGVSPIVV